MNTGGSLNLSRGETKMPKGKGYSLKNPPASEVMKKKGGPKSSKGSSKMKMKKGRSKKGY